MPDLLVRYLQIVANIAIERPCVYTWAAIQGLGIIWNSKGIAGKG